MLGARINIIQPQIRNLIAYLLLSLPDKQLTTAKRDKTSGPDRNDHQKCLYLQRTLLIRKGSIKYCLLLLWAPLKISCISWLCCVWNNVCVHVCKTQTDDLLSFVIVYILGVARYMYSSRTVTVRASRFGAWCLTTNTGNSPSIQKRAPQQCNAVW